MNKYKVTVESKSRSKVVKEIELDAEPDEIKEGLDSVFRKSTLRIGLHFFNTSNVNYVSFEKIGSTNE